MAYKDTDLLFSPDNLFDFELYIDGENYSKDLYSVRILSSVVSAYQVFILRVFFNTSDILLQKIFGQDPFILKIIPKDFESGSATKDGADIELFCINPDFSISMKEWNPAIKQHEKVSYTIRAVPRKAFKTMTTLVNEVYENVTLQEVITDLATSNNALIEFDKAGINDKKISQIIVPPLTFYNAISYLDEEFGLYDGIPISFCRFDNKVFIKNLTKKMDKAQKFTIHQLASDLDTTDIENLTKDGKNFLTYSEINTQYKANSKFALLSKNIKHIVKPSDTLYHLIEDDLMDMCLEYGLISNRANKKIQIDNDLNNRTRYFIDRTGYEKTESFINSKIAKAISGLSTLNISLEKNLPILNLIDVGECVMFKSKILDFVDLNGKYILKSSNLFFYREGQWQSTASLNLIRTNKTHV